MKALQNTEFCKIPMTFGIERLRNRSITIFEDFEVGKMQILDKRTVLYSLL